MANAFAAYSVYYYDANKIGYGMAGRILDTGSAVGASPNLNTSLNGDPKVAGFTDSSNALRVAVTDYVTGSSRPVTIYNATSAASVATPSWSSIQNLYSLVKLGSFLYAMDYDNARVVEINAGTYAQTGRVYNLPASLTPSGFKAYGQALVVAGGQLYGLFTFANSTWTSYANSLLVRFDLTTTPISVGSTASNGSFAPNAFSLAVSGNDIYIAAIGGSQGSSGVPNAASRLQKIDYTLSNLTTAPITNVMSPSTTYPYEIRDISFKGSTAYVLVGTYNSSWQLAGKLLSTTNFTTFTTINDFSAGAAGYFWTAQYTADNDRIWFARGNQILVYTAASLSTPAATLGFAASPPYRLITTGQLYDNLNDLTFIGALGTQMKMHGYRSPIQASNSLKAIQARIITQGRPELTEEEFKQLDEEFKSE